MFVVKKREAVTMCRLNVAFGADHYPGLYSSWTTGAAKRTQGAPSSMRIRGADRPLLRMSVILNFIGLCCDKGRRPDGRIPDVAADGRHGATRLGGNRKEDSRSMATLSGFCSASETLPAA